MVLSATILVAPLQYGISTGVSVATALCVGTDVHRTSVVLVCQLCMCTRNITTATAHVSTTWWLGTFLCHQLLGITQAALDLTSVIRMGQDHAESSHAACA
jgi:hypothetical protein